MITEEIERRATEWVLRQDRGDFSEADQTALENWLAQDVRHRQAYMECDGAWELTDGLGQWRPREGTIDPDLFTAADTSAWHRILMPAALAASVLTILSAAVWYGILRSQTEGYSTPTGGYERVRLGDGSVMQLNTQTVADVHLGESLRQVRLRSGEAYFQVAQDPHRPFEVIADKTVVRAVGTAFSVRLDPNKPLEVLVTHGRVLVLPQGIKADQSLIEAGQRALAARNEVQIVSAQQSQMARQLAWQNGLLMFDGQTLMEVAGEFNRYNRRKVQIGDERLEQIKLTGNFEAGDLESFLAAVKSAAQVQIERGDEQIVIRFPR